MSQICLVSTCTFILVNKRITVLKVETDINNCITASLTGRAAKLMLVYIETINKTDVIGFNRERHVLDITLTDNFQYQSLSIDNENIYIITK